MSFFHNFLPRNSLTGSSTSAWSSIHDYLCHDEGVANIVFAIGALEISNNDRVPNGQISDALGSYNIAVTTLRIQIDTSSPSDLLRLAWTSILLGLFELMYDSTGSSWTWHILFGTSRILQLLGPDGCRSGRSREFFQEFRVFEIAHSMLFSKPSFLATRSWVELTNELLLEARDQETWLREKLLNIMTLVSDLCVRTTKFLITTNGTDFGQNETQALYNYSEEGHRLRFELSSWQSIASLHSLSASNGFQMTVPWIFYSAISIYLSGVYDYSPLWSHHGIIVSSLDPILIQHHVSSIIDLTDTAIRDTNLPGLLFLFPLRIAGARADTAQTRIRISRLLKSIQRRFRAAAAVKADLDDVWRKRPVFQEEFN